MEDQVDKIKAWFMTFLFGLQAAWNVVIHLPVIEPLLELLVKQRVLIAIIAFAAGVYIPQIPGIAPGMADLLVLAVIGICAYLIKGLQKEVEIDLLAMKPINRAELEQIVTAAIKTLLVDRGLLAGLLTTATTELKLPSPPAEKFTQVG